MIANAGISLRKSIVLVGAGNAHLTLLKRWKMAPLPDVSLTLVNEGALLPYSAMVPAFLARNYHRTEIEIDLVRLSSASGVRLIREAATRVDPLSRTVHFADRPPLSYDVVSLNLGSLASLPETTDPKIAQLFLRPLGRLLDDLAQLEKTLERRTEPFHLAVVGGGASGAELALAIRRRFARYPALRMSLLQGADRLLPQQPLRVGERFARVIRERGIALHLGARVTAVRQSWLDLDNGDQLACEAVLWATQAAPPPLLRNAGVATDSLGFMRVHPTLQSVSEPAVFGAGDCVSVEGHPTLPRNGVLAVREGPTLLKNILAYIDERPLEPFRPRPFYLSLLDTGDGQAVASYGPFVARGHWAMRWKRRIDREWLRSLHELSAMSAGREDTRPMRCGGCGSKIPGQVLARVLERLDIPSDPRVLIGCREGEDAAVIRPPAGMVEVQTVDFFKSFISDPFLFGRIAALHAVSDLYAMNATPLSALAIVTLPYATAAIHESWLFELLSGALRELERMGVVLAGGHTTEGVELALGFSVTGYADASRLFRKGALQEGDALILTKALGSGALLAAIGRGRCPAVSWDLLLRALLSSNAEAGRVLAGLNVKACTDVTGFGLAGHLLEMLEASHVSARLWPERLPLLSGFDRCVEDGILSSLHPENAKLSYRVKGESPAALFDPQTAGGLLFGIPGARATDALRKLHAAGYRDTQVIGEVIASQLGEPEGIWLESVRPIAPFSAPGSWDPVPLFPEHPLSAD